ncbi:sortase [Patescibacteria group bacterium]|nr:sortase [Patescibacteria group bacterium]
MKAEVFKVFVLRWIGNFLVLSAVAAVVLTFAPAVQAEITYRVNVARNVHYVVAGDLPPAKFETTSTNLLAKSETILEINPLSTEFGIVIPKIGANAKVIPNVDPGNETEYLAALKEGVAHAAGTVFPGQVGNSYLFAHSVGNFWEVSRWNAVFYLLKELEPGDEVDLFYKNVRYVYVVYDKKVVEPDDTQYLTTQANFPMLTLQTCWPPGTTLKRLLVFGRLKNI